MSVRFLFSSLLLGALFSLSTLCLQAAGMNEYTNVSLTATNSLPARLMNWQNPPVGAVPQSRMAEGMLDVTKYPYYADKTGVADARTAIQNAIDDALAANLIVFFPSGTYLCDGGLTLAGPGRAARKFANKLVGSTVGPRPVLRLKDGASVTNNLITGSASADYPIFIYFNLSSTGDENASGHFCSTLRGINIDMGNNPNVSAVRMQGAQYCVIEDVDIYGAAFAYGLDGIPGGGGSSSNVKITGGKVGVKVQWRPVPLITGLQLVGQSQYGIWAQGDNQMEVVGFNIVGPAANTPGYVAVTGTAALVLVDGSIQVTNQATGRGIVCPSGNDVYLQNVYIKADTCVSGGGSTLISGSETTWKQISEYTFRSAGNNGQLVVNGTDYGASTNTTLPTVTDGVTPPANLVSKHLWTTNFPSWEDAGRINITSPPYNAVPNNANVDNGPAIQAALNAAGGTNTVFIPRGHFFVRSQINVPAGSKLIGAGENISALQAPTDWILTAPASILNTADDPTNGVTLAHFAVVGNDPSLAGSSVYGSGPDATSQSNLTYVTVQTGNTIWRNIQIDQKPASLTGVRRDSSRVVFKNSAGGKVYNLVMDQGGGTHAAGQPLATYHLISVQNTTAPLAFYQPDVEYYDSSTKIGIQNAGEVSLFGFKYEATKPSQLLAASDVKSLRVMGGGQNYLQGSAPIIELSQCDRVRIVNLQRTVKVGETAGRFWLSGQGSTLTDQRDITLYSYDKAPPTYTVTFDGNGGGIPSPTNKSVTYAATYGALATVTRTGSTFKGWFTATTGGTLVTSATTVAITAAQTLYAQWTASTPGTHSDRWALTFADEFGGTSLDTTKWEAAEDELRQSKASRWKSNQVSVSGGLLRLGITKVTDDPEPTVRYHCGTVRGRKGYTSQYTFKQKYGYYEARYKLPARIDKDYWAAFWLMAGPVGAAQPDTTKAMEIDIMESFTFDRSFYTANFHWAGYGTAHNKYSLNCGTWPKQQVILNSPGGYHVYGFYWDKDFYIFYLDGEEIGRTDMKGLGDPNLELSKGTAQVEGYMLLSAEAAKWPGDSSQDWDVDAPAQDEFLVDYVRVYDLKPAFISNPVIGNHAAENTAYQATLAGSATDVSGGALTFAKSSGGPAWLNVAADGTLSGTPSSSDLGVNRFNVSVSDGISTVQAALDITVKSTFEVWSSGSASTFVGDGNGDSVPDGIAWFLGSTTPGQSANKLLPTTQRSNDGGLTLSFSCLNTANRGSAILSLQFSSDMGLTDRWDNHTVVIPPSSSTDQSSGVAFVIKTNIQNANLNDVSATIPASVANGNGKIFGRLKALPAP